MNEFQRDPLFTEVVVDVEVAPHGRGWFLPGGVHLSGYTNLRRLMPAVLRAGAGAAFLLEERTAHQPTVT